MGRKKKEKNDVDAAETALDDTEFVEEPELPKCLHRDVQKFADRFDITDALAWQLDEVMEDRRDDYSRETVQRDFVTLTEELEKAEAKGENSNSTLVMKMKDLSEGRFITRSDSHDAVIQFCKAMRLDQGATAKLIDAMAVRERKYGEDIKQDLKILAVHLENSNAPSKLVSMRLKDIRAGYKLGNCVYARAKEGVVGPEEGGPSLEGHRVPRSRPGYSDHELAQRFGSSADAGGGVIMTEEEARKFQKSMRANGQGAREPEKKASQKEKVEKDRHGRSRSRKKTTSRGRSRSRKKHSRSQSQTSNKKGASGGKERKQKGKRSRSRSRSQNRKKDADGRSESHSRKRTQSRSQSQRLKSRKKGASPGRNGDREKRSRSRRRSKSKSKSKRKKSKSK